MIREYKRRFPFNLFDDTIKIRCDNLDQLFEYVDRKKGYEIIYTGNPPRELREPFSGGWEIWMRPSESQLVQRLK